MLTLSQRGSARSHSKIKSYLLLARKPFSVEVPTPKNSTDETNNISLDEPSHYDKVLSEFETPLRASLSNDPKTFPFVKQISLDVFPKKEKVLRKYPFLREDVLDNGTNLDTLNPISRRSVNPSTGLFTLSTPPSFHVCGPQNYPSLADKVFIHRDGDVEVILVPTSMNTDSSEIFNVFSALPDFPHDAVLNLSAPTQSNSPSMLDYPVHLNPKFANISAEVYFPTLNRDEMITQFHSKAHDPFPLRRGMTKAAQLLFAMHSDPKLTRRRWWVTLENAMNRLKVSGVSAALQLRDPQSLRDLRTHLHVIIAGSISTKSEPQSISYIAKNARLHESAKSLLQASQFTPLAADLAEKMELLQQLQKTSQEQVSINEIAMKAVQNLANARAKIHAFDLSKKPSSTTTPASVTEQATTEETSDQKQENEHLPDSCTDPVLHQELMDAKTQVEATIADAENIEKVMVELQAKLQAKDDAESKIRKKELRNIDMQLRDEAGKPDSIYDTNGVSYVEALRREVDIALHFEEALLFAAGLRERVDFHKSSSPTSKIENSVKRQEQHARDEKAAPRRQIIAFIRDECVQYVREVYDVIDVLSEDDWYYLYHGYTAALRKKYFPDTPSIDISFDTMASKLTKQQLLEPIKNVNRLFTDIHGPILGPRSCSSCIMSYSDAGYYAPECISKTAKYIKTLKPTEQQPQAVVGSDVESDAITVTGDDMMEFNLDLDAMKQSRGSRPQDPCSIYPKLTELQLRSLRSSRLRDANIHANTAKYIESYQSNYPSGHSVVDYIKALKTGLNPVVTEVQMDGASFLDRNLALHVDLDGNNFYTVYSFVSRWRAFTKKLQSLF